ncbi:Hypothetical predicted protein [Podarcis lilfordi]|uniref:Uncharacterized protein n=1 Tax=Podarcis lilfordi TaxID=74358 RepID=A0AA35JVN7_9SAUR|nr:Hypothetical predicted protein [Podarcis lilfordi]
MLSLDSSHCFPAVWNVLPFRTCGASLAGTSPWNGGRGENTAHAARFSAALLTRDLDCLVLPSLPEADFKFLMRFRNCFFTTGSPTLKTPCSGSGWFCCFDGVAPDFLLYYLNGF